MFKFKHLKSDILSNVESITNGDLLLSWLDYRDYGVDIINTDDTYFDVYLDGNLYKKTNESKCVISNLSPSTSHQINIINTNKKNKNADLSTYIYYVPRGNRLKITVPLTDLETNPDFYSYKIYWSADGTEPTVLMAENVGVNNNTFNTAILADGTDYKFRSTLVDWLGNESAYGATLTASINTLPEAVDNPLCTYAEVTRKATITATAPTPQDADCVAYRLYSNHLIGHGLQDYVIDLYPVAEFKTTDTISYTTHILYAGDWIYEFRAIDKTGLESSASTINLSLAIDGTDLIEVLQPPLKPIYFDAVPVADACVKINVTLSDLINASGIRVYINSVEYDTIAIVANTYKYSFTTETLTDGADYTIYCKTYNVNSESIKTDSITVTVDGSAPTGNLTLTSELI